MAKTDEEFVLRGADLHEPLSSESIGAQLYKSFIVRPPEKAALINAVTKEKITYQELLDVTCKLAMALKNAGYKKGDVISVSMENSLEFYQIAIAALYLGIYVSCLNPDYLEDEIFQISTTTRQKIAFCSKSVVENYIKIKNRCNWMERIIVTNSDEHVEGAESLKEFIECYCEATFNVKSFRPVALDSKEDVAFIFCSSGTTGLPKSVVLTHENISMQINHSQDPSLNNINPDSIKMGVLPFFHVFGCFEYLATLALGQTLVVLPKFTADSFLTAIQDYKVKSVTIVPTITHFLAKSPTVDDYDLTSLKSLAVGAGILKADLQEAVLQRLNLDYVQNVYGLTETTHVVLATPVGTNKLGCGKIMPGMEGKIQDLQTGRTLGPNQIGELCFKGGLIMKGYLCNPKATAEMITCDGWLLSGDLGYYDAEGYFYVVDRIKEIIKYKGYQVSPTELEEVLLKHPGVEDAGVVGEHDEHAGEVPLAFVVAKHNYVLTEKEIVDFVAQHVSHSKRLHGGVKFVKVIPRSAVGKIKRKELKKLMEKLNKM